jgi:hypothetical protein
VSRELVNALFRLEYIVRLMKEVGEASFLWGRGQMSLEENSHGVRDKGDC